MKQSPASSFHQYKYRAKPPPKKYTENFTVSLSLGSLNAIERDAKTTLIYYQAYS